MEGDEEQGNPDSQFLNIVRNLQSSNCYIKKLCLMKKRNKDGMCPIHLAVMNANLDIIRNFISLVPDCINVRNSNYKTPLHVAVQNRQLEVVKELLPKGEEKKEKFFQMVSEDYDIDGNNALHLAAKNGDLQIVKELLKWPGARVSAVNKDGLTAFDIAAHLSALAPEADINYEKIKRILEAIGGSRGQSDGKKSKELEVDTVVASLIATITFAAIFQIPGGIEDNKNSVQHEAARMALKFIFQCFLMSDVLAFSASITVIIGWLFRERLQAQLYKTRYIVAYLSQLGLGVAIIATGIAFVCATFLIIIPPNVHGLVTKHKKEFEAYVQIWKSVTAAVTVMPALAFIVYIILSRKQILRLSNPEILMVPLPLRLTMFGIALFPFILLIYSNIALKN